MPHVNKTDIELSKVHSYKIREDLYAVLQNTNPCHYSRLWLVGFLKYVGYSATEIIAIIYSLNVWERYNERTTYLHIQSVFRNHSGISEQFTGVHKGDFFKNSLCSQVAQNINKNRNKILLGLPRICTYVGIRAECYNIDCSQCDLYNEVNGVSK